MKITCKQTTSKGFNLKEVTTVTSNNYDYNFGGYGIELNKEYLVMGIAIYKNSNCLYYLTDVNGEPDWFPYLLFDVADNYIPRNWFILVSGKNDDTGIYLLCGFDELCNDSDFHDQLLEGDEEAMRIYFRRRMELEKELLEKELLE
ncbi:MAG: hypothetical protein JNM36_11495 [Chitinophagales bacterium]|jgi:hypothetical protein|nr:hypothetical protein [Chitinophagales bacterium]